LPYLRTRVRFRKWIELNTPAKLRAGNRTLANDQNRRNGPEIGISSPTSAGIRSNPQLAKTPVSRTFNAV